MKYQNPLHCSDNHRLINSIVDHHLVTYRNNPVLSAHAYKACTFLCYHSLVSAIHGWLAGMSIFCRHFCNEDSLDDGITYHRIMASWRRLTRCYPVSAPAAAVFHSVQKRPHGCSYDGPMADAYCIVSYSQGAAKRERVSWHRRTCDEMRGHSLMTGTSRDALFPTDFNQRR